jgi:hypothetical protein
MTAATALRSRWVKLIRELAQALGNHSVGALAGLIELALSLLLGVVDHTRGGSLSGIDDPR